LLIEFTNIDSVQKVPKTLGHWGTSKIGLFGIFIGIAARLEFLANNIVQNNKMPEKDQFLTGFPKDSIGGVLFLASYHPTQFIIYFIFS
jgi:hypothetical protein